MPNAEPPIAVNIAPPGHPAIPAIPAIPANVIDALLERKRGAPEMGLGDPVSGINAFVEQQLARLETMHPESTRPPGAVQALNTLFHAVLDESAA